MKWLGGNRWEWFLLHAIVLVVGAIKVLRWPHLPVIVVKRWDEVTPAFLEEEWRRLPARRFDFDKLWQPFWLLLMLREVLRTL